MNNPRVKKKHIAILVFLLSMFFTYKYVYQKHRNIETEKPVFVINSSDLIQEFTLNIEASSKKYTNKTIEISGFVTAVDSFTLEINKRIICYFNKPINFNNLLNKKISLKGRCLGFDELLEEIKLDQCTIITN